MSQRMNRAQRILLITILIKMELLRRQRAQRIVRRGGFVAGLPKHTHTEADITDLSIGFGDLTGSIANAQTPNTLLLDGSRSMTGDFKLNYGKKARFETSAGFSDPVDGSADILWDDSLWALSLQSADGSYKMGLDLLDLYIGGDIIAMADELDIISKNTTGKTKIWGSVGGSALCLQTSMSKQGVETNTIDELTTGSGVTVEGILLKDASLSGVINAILSGYLSVDAIAEKTTATGVTVDGMLIKDGVIPDSGNLNFYLRDGSRYLTGDMNFAGSYDITRLVRLEFEDDVGLFRRSVNRLGVIKVPGTDPADLDCRELFTDDISEYTAAAGVTVDGLLIKDSVIPDSGYPNALLLDGSKQMTGALDLEVGGHLVTFLKSKNFAFKEQGLPVSKILLMNRAETDYMSFYLKTLFATQGVQASSFAPLGNAHNYIQSYGDTAKHVYIQSYNGSMVTCIDLYNGKVLMPNLPVADPHVADQLWNNGGVLTVSSG